jgi:hypothetical protein
VRVDATEGASVVAPWRTAADTYRPTLVPHTAGATPSDEQIQSTHCPVAGVQCPQFDAAGLDERLQFHHSNADHPAHPERRQLAALDEPADRQQRHRERAGHLGGIDAEHHSAPTADRHPILTKLHGRARGERSKRGPGMVDRG